MEQATQRTEAGESARIEKQRKFIRAMSKSIDGQPLTGPERALLDAIFEALLRGEDVSELTGVKRPHTRRSSDPMHVALHYLCLTRLMGTPADTAWSEVGAAWGLNKRHVQWLIAQNREPALAALQRFASDPDRLLRICERHARGARPDRGASGLAPAMQRSGDTLIRMLTQLLQGTVVSERPAP